MPACCPGSFHGHVVYSESARQRHVGRRAELYPNSLSGKARQAEWTSQNVGARRTAVQIAEGSQRSQQSSTSATNLNEEPIELSRGGRLICAYVQPEVERGGGTTGNCYLLERGVARVVGRAQNQIPGA